MSYFFFVFFFQAEDGIRDGHVTGVQTCALPILIDSELERERKVDRVLPRQGRNRKRNARQVDALVRADPPTDDHLTAGTALVDLAHTETDETVVDQHV